MRRTENDTEPSKTFVLALLVVTVAALYLAAEVLIPVAMAILLTFILAPVVTRMERLGLGRVVSILLAVGAVFLVLFGIGFVVGNQMMSLANDSARYRDNVVARIQTFKRTDTGPLSRLERIVKSLSGELSEIANLEPEKSAEEIAENTQRAAEAATADDSTARGPDSPDSTSPDSESPEPAEKSDRKADRDSEAIPVRIVSEGFSPYSILTGVLPGAFGWLATAGIVIVFVIFKLIERENLRNRVIRLLGSDQINMTTQALDDAAARVSSYLRAQLIINASYGGMMAVALYLAGLPNALLLGLLGGLLRYIPYVGPWLGALLGIGLAIAVAPPDDWTMPLIVIGLYVAAELFSNNVMEPVLYHSSTGISTIGILVAALFWTWLWGPVGLVLSTPLTVCIIVLGRYVPSFRFLSILLSDDEALPPASQFYQRLLAGDEEESRTLVEEYLKEHSLDQLIEQMLLPALELTEQDTHLGTLDEGRRHYILENIQDLLDELPELSPPAAAPEENVPAEPSTPPSRAVVIVPARDLADEIASEMLALRLRELGIEPTVLSTKLLFGETIEAISRLPSPLIVVSAVPPYAVRHARNLTKRLRHRLHGVKIIVGIWTDEEHSKRTDSRLASAGSDRLFNRLSEAVEVVERYMPGRTRPAETPSDKPAESATAP